MKMTVCGKLYVFRVLVSVLH